MRPPEPPFYGATKDLFKDLAYVYSRMLPGGWEKKWRKVHERYEQLVEAGHDHRKCEYLLRELCRQGDFIVTGRKPLCGGSRERVEVVAALYVARFSEEQIDEIFGSEGVVEWCLSNRKEEFDRACADVARDASVYAEGRVEAMKAWTLVECETSMKMLARMRDDAYEQGDSANAGRWCSAILDSGFRALRSTGGASNESAGLGDRFVEEAAKAKELEREMKGG